MRATHLIPSVVVVIVVASTAPATSFLVPSDDWLISRADVIVTGTVADRHERVGSRGLIETVYTIRVDDSLKGLSDGELELEVVELGGTLGGDVLHVAGAPRYDIGQRYLVFLRRSGVQLSTYDLALGRFEFRAGMAGEQVLVRDEHVVRPGEETTTTSRPAAEFLMHVREAVRHGRDALQQHHEMNMNAEQQGGDLRLAANIASGSWSGDESSSIRYSVSSEIATGDAAGDDGEDRVIAGDPHDLIPGTLGVDSSVIAVAIYGCRAGGCLAEEDPVRGGRYAGIEWSDVLLNDVGPNIVLSQPLLNTVVTHELGHTLGFRHANRVKNDQNPSVTESGCSEPLPCSTEAVMSAEVDETLNGVLAEWDRNAANAVYGDGSRSGHAPYEFVDDMYVASTGEWLPAKRFATEVAWKLPQSSCDPIALVEQPESVTVAAGDPVTLKVTASGSGVEIRWYEGEQGDTKNLVAYGPSLTLESIERSTSYWVLVAGPCAMVASETARVTVRAPCPPEELCALSNQFHISLHATDQRTKLTGRGVPTRENDLFGSFSLPDLTGNPDNPEVFVKMLDGRDVNGEFWVFYGGLTDLDYVLVVTDADSGVTRNYHKPAGSSAGGFDVGGGVSAESCSAEVDGLQLAAEASTGCDADELCLDRGRFSVELEARDPRTGKTGVGTAISQTDIAGYFALPELTGNPRNPEAFVKVLDGRTVNGHFWVFYSGLTDLEYSIVVTDHVNGARKGYVKPAGSACGAFDTNAF